MNTPVKSRRLGAFATAGSVVSAVASSACCWLPLVLIAFGASAVGVASFFEKYRPVFLILATVLLGAGFYLNYFRKESCAPGSACAVPRPGLRRFNRVTLWVATAFVVAFSFFPSYVGLLVGGVNADLAQPAEGGAQTLVMGIDGMTCEGCAGILSKALSAVPGVMAVEVSYEDRSAVVKIGGDTFIDAATLETVVENAGYSIRTIHDQEVP